MRAEKKKLETENAEAKKEIEERERKKKSKVTYKSIPNEYKCRIIMYFQHFRDALIIKK